MKSIPFALMILCTGCMIVLEEDPNREQTREEERHYYYSDDSCEDREPYTYPPEYCDIYSLSSAEDALETLNKYSHRMGCNVDPISHDLYEQE